MDGAFLRAMLSLVTGQLLCLSASAAETAPAPAPAGSARCDIKFGSFGTSATYLVADQQGYFTKEGVKVCKSTVNGSVDQFQQLFNGTFDIISTTTDGTVNRFVNGDTLFLNGNQSTAVPAPVVQLVAGSYQTLDLSLWGCSAAVPTLANLSTNELGVDAPDSGFAFSARAYLTGQGLAYNATANIKTARALPGQYSSVNVGGSRYTLVQACKVNATIINAPSTIVAMAPGTNITLLDGGQLNGPPGTVQNSGYTVRRGWPEQGNNAASLRAFLGALIRGSRFMRDPANRDVMVSKFVNASVTGQLGGGVVLNRDQAAAYLDVVNSATDGENFDAGLNQVGVQNTISLRQGFCGFSVAGANATNAQLGVPLANTATSACGVVNATALAVPCPTCMINLDYLNASIGQLAGSA